MRDRNAPLTASGLDSLDWAKGGGLIPAIVQDSATLQLLMLGYMNRESLEATLASGLVTFYSRSRAALWRKGETSGNLLRLDAVHCDCDGDALLVLCRPEGPTCHLGTPSCFTAEGPQGIGFVAELQRIIERRSAAPPEESYTARMMAEGPVRIAQKVGEEGVELALAAATGDRTACIEEAADLVFHVGLLMQARGFGWSDVAAELRRRHEAAGPRPE
jgi:phosphoribosyl-ATP pyrophosphohydrolase/phosphoribosyl-AMP cyclohydrolase